MLIEKSTWGESIDDWWWLSFEFAPAHRELSLEFQFVLILFLFFVCVCFLFLDWFRLRLRVVGEEWRAELAEEEEEVIRRRISAQPILTVTSTVADMKMITASRSTRPAQAAPVVLPEPSRLRQVTPSSGRNGRHWGPGGRKCHRPVGYCRRLTDGMICMRPPGCCRGSGASSLARLAGQSERTN